MTSPAALIHHEDLVVGETLAFGAYTVTKDEIVAYARQFDPQPMHLDEAAAMQTLVGGLCAAGYHTCALMMRVLYDGFIRNSASLGSPGMDEVRWLKPVRPGDTLSMRLTILEKRDLASRPDVGLSRVTYDMLNQAGESVISTQSNQLFRRRTPGVAAPRAPATAGGAKPAAPIASLWDMPFTPPTDPLALYFEDREIGESADLGAHTFTRDEIVDFAREFDPQPFHLDEAAAKASLFGGLCASGWHTCAIYIRQIVRERQANAALARAAGRPLPAYGPSPGFKNLRWLKPVFVGDTIEFRTRLADKIDLKSRPERGLIQNETQGRNQKGEIVFSVTGQVLAERRTPFVGG